MQKVLSLFSWKKMDLVTLDCETKCFIFHIAHRIWDTKVNEERTPAHRTGAVVDLVVIHIIGIGCMLWISSSPKSRRLMSIHGRTDEYISTTHVHVIFRE